MATASPLPTGASDDSFDASPPMGAAPPDQHPAPPGAWTGSAPPPVAQPLGPTAPHERILLLDVLRGVALLGIFMVNMPLFAFTMFEGFGGPGLIDATPRDRLGWWIVAVIFQFKFISMFSLLFGAGFALQVGRATARGRSPAITYLRRLGSLFCIGILHPLLLWCGDILVAYSITGLILLPFARVSGRTLVVVGVCVLLVSGVVGGGLGAMQSIMMSKTYAAMEAEAEADLPAEEWIEAEGTDMDAGEEASEPPRGFNGLLQMQFNPMHPDWVDAESAAFREGPFRDAFAFRVTLWGFAIIAGVFGWLWHVAGVFLIGAGLMRLGFFAPEAARARARCAWLVIPGLAFEFLAAWLAARSGWSGDVLSATVGGAHGPTAVMLTLGYVGLISMAVDASRGCGGALAVSRFIANTGRMALTVYLSESLIAAAIMYWWGLAWFGTIDRLSLIGMVALIWLGLAIFANLWFKAFRIGPMEWVWRMATYGGTGSGKRELERGR